MSYGGFGRSRLETVFINIMKKILYLNKKYKFVHGDLKPDNIIINKECDDVLLIDFDLSRIGEYYSYNQKFFNN